jgi:hypothetical protein
MKWFDPRECLEAEQFLAQGNPLQAARVLLASKYPHHKSVRRCLAEVQKHLLSHAAQHWERGQEEAAWEWMEMAARCGDLPPEAVDLRRQLQQAKQARERQQAWRQAKLQEARELARTGHLHTAIDILTPLGDQPEVQQALCELRQQQSRFERAVAACRECLERGEAALARRHWEKARSIVPDHPDVAVLSREIAQLMARQDGFPRESRPAPVRQRHGRFVLAQTALVILNSEVVVGTDRGENVHLPVFGPLHRRHAMLFRDSKGWYITPFTDKSKLPCKIWVDDQLIHHGLLLTGVHRLAFGDSRFRWVFSMPVAGSLTAVLEPTLENPGPVLRDCPAGVRKVILLADQLVLRPGGLAHCLLPELPCEEIRLVWTAEGLCWQVEDAEASAEIPGGTISADDRLVYVPSYLLVQRALSEAEVLGRMLVGLEASPTYRVEFAACSL